MLNNVIVQQILLKLYLYDQALLLGKVFELICSKHIHYLVCRSHRVISFPCCLAVFWDSYHGDIEGLPGCNICLRDYGYALGSLWLISSTGFQLRLFESDRVNLLGNHFINNDHDVTGSLQILHINIGIKIGFLFQSTSFIQSVRDPRLQK